MKIFTFTFIYRTIDTDKVYDRPHIQCIFSTHNWEISRLSIVESFLNHFCVTSYRVDLGKFCIAALLVMKIKIKKYEQYFHICFENYLLN